MDNKNFGWPVKVKNWNASLHHFIQRVNLPVGSMQKKTSLHSIFPLILLKLRRPDLSAFGPKTTIFLCLKIYSIFYVALLQQIFWPYFLVCNLSSGMGDALAARAKIR